MIHQTIALKVPDSQKYARFCTYFLDRSEDPALKKRPLVIVVPGGGYVFTSPREGEPVAMKYLAKGYHAIVLWYSVKPAVFPTALLELAQTVRFARKNASAYDIDPNRIIVAGFSAGAHLAASLGNFWPSVAEDAESIDLSRKVRCEDFRPNGQILAYPVITSGPFAHNGSFAALLGEGTGHPAAVTREQVSLENSVSADTPPTFLWHTAADQAVPVENSLFMAGALSARKIPFELHVYPKGAHGMSLADASLGEADTPLNRHVSGWMDLSCAFIDQL